MDLPTWPEKLRRGCAVRLRIVLLLELAAAVAAAPVIAGFAGTDVFLPMVGRLRGVFPSDWYTTVWIYNASADAVVARLYLLERGTANPSPPWVDITVPPGDTDKLENVVETLFHRQVFGALRVTAPSRLVVTSRVYSKGAGVGEDDSVGQDFAGVPASFAIGAGEKTQILGTYQTLPTADSDFRFNFGFVETTGHSVGVRVSAYDQYGTFQDSKDFTVREWSQRQMALKDHFPTVSTGNSRLEVEGISGGGKVIAYGSAVANGSQDPTTFEMTYNDSLLGGGGAGLSSVAHDATLAGDGTPGAPLSLADGAVTSAKIDDGAVSPDDVGFTFAGSPSKGGPATDVACTGCVDAADVGAAAVGRTTIGHSGSSTVGFLHSDGSSLTWSDGTLTLPFSGSDSRDQPNGLLDITNTGTGFAIGGHGTTFPGVYGTGDSRGVHGSTGGDADSAGVLGTATFGTGVKGTATLGRGVWGEGGFAGVYGVGESGVLGINKADDSIWGSLGGTYGVYGTGPTEGARGRTTGDINSSGVHGIAGAGAGVRGTAAPGYGVWGEGQIGGVYGIGQEGVVGVNQTNTLIRGYLGGHYGVHGWGFGDRAGVFGTGPEEGVRGETAGMEESAGVLGKATYGSGVKGTATVGYGVRGEGGIGGVYGCCHPGVLGESTGGEGVVGRTGSGVGVRGISRYIAVLGETDLDAGLAVKGSNAATRAYGTLGGTNGVTGAAPPPGFAGDFLGDVRILGDVSCGACIQANAISPEGAANGQVLKSNGFSVVWGTDMQSGAFTLPVAEPGTSTGALFSITNSSSGAALKGSSSGYGVEGFSSGSAGVYGHSGSGLGIFGQSIGALGVYGLSTSAAGVYGRSGSGAGVEGYSVSSYGVYGHSDGHDGVRARTNAAGRSGVYSEAMHADATAVAGVNVNGNAGSLGGREYGVWGSGGAGGVAGYFQGHVYVTALGGSGNRAVYTDDKGHLHNSTSDFRLKKDIVDLGEEIDLVAALAGLRGVAFSWDTSQERAKNLGERREIGMIAQEVEAVLPQLVGETADGYKTLDYAKLTAFLVEVVKAQEARIRALEAAQASR
jgi:hypothetical protein